MYGVSAGSHGDQRDQIALELKLEKAVIYHCWFW